MLKVALVRGAATLAADGQIADAGGAASLVIRHGAACYRLIIPTHRQFTRGQREIARAAQAESAGRAVVDAKYHTAAGGSKPGQGAAAQVIRACRSIADQKSVAACERDRAAALIDNPDGAGGAHKDVVRPQIECAARDIQSGCGRGGIAHGNGSQPGCPPVSNVQRARADRCAACVGVRAGERERAVAGLGEAATLQDTAQGHVARAADIVGSDALEIHGSAKARSGAGIVVHQVAGVEERDLVDGDAGLTVEVERAAMHLGLFGRSGRGRWR